MTSNGLLQAYLSKQAMVSESALPCGRFIPASDIQELFEDVGLCDKQAPGGLRPVSEIQFASRTSLLHASLTWDFCPD